MSYKNTIPAAGDGFSKSQRDLLNNFLSLESTWNVNHVGIGNAPNEGKHSYITLPILGADPATGAGEIALYSKLAGALPALFSRGQNSGAVEQLSNTWLAANPGWMKIGNIIFKWGNGNFASGATTAFPYIAAPAVFTNVHTIIWCPFPSHGAQNAISIRQLVNPLTQFEIQALGGSWSGVCYYLAIGD